MRTRAILIAACALIASAADAQNTGRRRALLIGINDYSASQLGRRPTPARDWPNLRGAVNDATTMQEMLVLLYGFDRRDILLLTDQSATRNAILESLERHLVQPAAENDVIFFYFAGHGSQVRNSLSDEHDKLDESIVPADSRAGAPDIRDKELRRFFNRILDRGARLTILLDNCHSGSGARGLATGIVPRGIRMDPRDAADRTHAGPRPEERGALVLSASQDLQPAWETRDRDGMMHGAFSWAWIRALRDSSPDEPADETFLRAQARLRAETPFQDPAMAGNAAARTSRFLRRRTDRIGERAVVAVQKVRNDGTVVVQGGWANGLSIGSELRVKGDSSSTRLVITTMQGLGQSEARVQPPAAIKSGALLEIVGWAAPQGRPMRIWTARGPQTMKEIVAVAKLLESEARRRGVRWISDPLDATPTHLLRRTSLEWEILGTDNQIERVGGDGAAIAAVAKMAAGSSLFVQFAAPANVVDAIETGRGIETAERPEDADYILAGRYSARQLELAWLRPAVKRSDRRKSGLPLQTSWIADQSGTLIAQSASRLRKIHAWHQLASPAESRFPYRLAIRRKRTGEIQQNVALIGDDQYEVVLRAKPAPAAVRPRYVYAFAIDCYGKSYLIYPRGGGGENRLPLPDTKPPDIPLGIDGSFRIMPPYGVDTFFLLTTDEPLPNPFVLEWDGVRERSPSKTALEQLIMLTTSGERGRVFLTPSSWSLERIAFESRAPVKKSR